jgi:hypothetical protein
MKRTIYFYAVTTNICTGVYLYEVKHGQIIKVGYFPTTDNTSKAIPKWLRDNEIKCYSDIKELS